MSAIKKSKLLFPKFPKNKIFVQKMSKTMLFSYKKLKEHSILIRKDGASAPSCSPLRTPMLLSKMTLATDKLVYDISPAKTDSFKPVDQFWLFIKTMYPFCGDNVHQFIWGYSSFASMVPYPISPSKFYNTLLFFVIFTLFHCKK